MARWRLVVAFGAEPRAVARLCRILTPLWGRVRSYAHLLDLDAVSWRIEADPDQGEADG